MYIQVKNDPSVPVKISRKLFKDMNFEPKKNPWFIQIVKDKKSNDIFLIKRKNVDTFVTQCTMVTPTGDRKNPAHFMWTIPSFDYFMAILNVNMTTGKIFKVRKVDIPKIGKAWKICAE